jgi:lipase maturation factor 1
MKRFLRNLVQPAPAGKLNWGPAGWLFDPQAGSRNRFVPRWIFLRALAAIYFSAFFSLLFQIEGLNGPRGILPAQGFLVAVKGEIGLRGFWYAPTLFWLSSGSHMVMAVMWLGLIASVAAFCNAWPRLTFLVCFVCFLSFVAAAQAFSSYQSDSMLLEAGFLALFFAPRGLWPEWGIESPTSRASMFLLQWEWFRIYFESGIVKLLSGEIQWRNYSAMDEYYQNGPLPTWIGWYVEQLPHWFHAATVVATLAMEIVVVWMLFLPMRARFICFCIVTPWEIGVILTANYTFLNYLVLALGFLLLDDRSVRWLLPKRLRGRLPDFTRRVLAPRDNASTPIMEPENSSEDERSMPAPVRSLSGYFNAARVTVAAFMLIWLAYATSAEMLEMPWPALPLPSAPVMALEPFRIANQYGLFAIMTRGRYEIEFQGSNDGQHWTPYLFRYKPQALNEKPRIYAPYQPRFEWNLWFASLGDWQQSDFVPLTEERLLDNDADVLSLFQENPFPHAPPLYVRAVLWQYWFTSIEEKRRTGNWWKRTLIGLYAPELTRQADGAPGVVEWPEPLPRHE